MNYPYLSAYFNTQEQKANAQCIPPLILRTTAALVFLCVSCKMQLWKRSGRVKEKESGLYIQSSTQKVSLRINKGLSAARERKSTSSSTSTYLRSRRAMHSAGRRRRIRAAGKGARRWRHSKRRRWRRRTSLLLWRRLLQHWRRFVATRHLSVDAQPVGTVVTTPTSCKRWLLRRLAAAWVERGAPARRSSQLLLWLLR